MGLRRRRSRAMLGLDTITAIQEEMVDWASEEIDDLFALHGFAVVAEPGGSAWERRRRRVEAYVEQIRWNDHDEVRRAMRVVETIMASTNKMRRNRIAAGLRADGLRYENGRILPGRGDWPGAARDVAAMPAPEPDARIDTSPAPTPARDGTGPAELGAATETAPGPHPAAAADEAGATPAVGVLTASGDRPVELDGLWAALEAFVGTDDADDGQLPTP